MNQQKRLLLIIEQLQKEKSLSLKDIMQLTGASRDTARRDTIKLSDSNLVVRNYGGISLINTFNKIDSFLDRSDSMLQIKKEIVKAAANLIEQEKIGYFDVSTTISLMPQFLTAKSDLHSITNSLDIADQFLKNTDCKTTMLGGTLDKNSRAVSGGYPLLELTKYNIDIAFLSCAGVDKQGIYYAHDEDIAMKTKIREQAKTLVVACDHTKIGLDHNFLVYSFEDIDYFITDKELPEEISHLIGDQKIIYSGGKKNV